MKISVAQIKPVKGDIAKNKDKHKELIGLALTRGTDMIIFPELSLTGYEPELAKGLATNAEDSQFDDLQEISDTSHITIGVGMPTKAAGGICISLVFFQPHLRRQTYSKQYLHADEEGFFINGKEQLFLEEDNNRIAPAICYETSVHAHAENAFREGANIYLASVLNYVKGIDRNIKRMSEIAAQYKMTVLMANYIGQSGGYDCAGYTSIWNNKGILIGQLDNKNEGILTLDNITGEVTEDML